MTAGETRTARRRGSQDRVRRGRPGTARAGMRLVRLYATSRRVPAAVIAIAACAVGLRIALIGHWDAYGALQLPLVFETAAAAVIAVTTASPLGEPERVTGRWLPCLRLAATLALTAAAVGALAAAGTGAHLAGGTLDVLRNVAGMTGIGLLCAATLGGGLAWAGPAAYLMPGAYALVHPVAPPGADHAVALARPAAARPGRGDLRRAGVHRRGRAHHAARSPRPGWRVGPSRRPRRAPRHPHDRRSAR